MYAKPKRGSVRSTTAGFYEAACGVYRSFIAQGRSHSELNGTELGPERRRQVTCAYAGWQAPVHTADSYGPQCCTLLPKGEQRGAIMGVPPAVSHPVGQHQTDL